MLHRLHRISACVIGSFVVFHLGNHLIAFGGIEAHLAVMERLRSVYRLTAVELLLLFCVAFQVGSGLWFVKSRWGQRSGFLDRLQAASGAYLAFFLLIHVGAVLAGRLLMGLDTNFYFAAAGMHVSPFQWYFVPYYFLAVVAIFVHVACGLHWLLRHHMNEAARNLAAGIAVLVGVVLAVVIVSALAGVFYEVAVPPEYLDSYR